MGQFVGRWFVAEIYDDRVRKYSRSYNLHEKTAKIIDIVSVLRKNKLCTVHYIVTFTM